MSKGAVRAIAVSLGVVLLNGESRGHGARSFKSGPIQITADGAWVWAANQHHDSVSRINTGTNAVDAFPLPDIGTPHSPRGLSVGEDGSQVWVACHDSDLVYVLSGSGAVIGRIDLPWGSGPYSVALSRDQSVALVTLHRGDALAVLEAGTLELSMILEPVFHAPLGIVWLEDGGSAWVTHLFSDEEHSRLTKVDISGAQPRVQTRIIAFATDPRQSSGLASPYDIAEGGYLTFRGHLAQIPSGSGSNRVWLPTQYHNITEDIYSPDSTIQAVIRHLDLESRTVPNTNSDKIILSAVHVHDPSAGNAHLGPGWNAGISGPNDIAFSADGSVAYLVNEASNDLIIVPTNTPAVRPGGAPPLTEIGVGDQPMGVAVSPVEPVAYVYNLLSRDVSVVDLVLEAETARLAVTPSTPEPFSPDFLTGARLFHTSDDPRLSGNSKVSCASCHIHGEHESRTWAFHNLPGPHGPRESPSLLGLGLTYGPRDPATGWGQLHRSGDRDEVQDFEHTIQGPTMGGTGFLGAGVQPELGAPNAGLDADLDALATYLLSRDPIMRSPYREDDGSLSEAAVRGATFFVGADRAGHPADAGCASCHVPETGFVDFSFHDVGQRRPGQEEELNNRSPAWHVNTPTLIGVWSTPPYNGVSGFAGTIFDVLEDQAARAGGARPHGTPDGLTGRQMADLAEFVLSIDGNMTAAEVRDARDTSPPRVVRVEPASLSRVVVWFNETVDEASVENPANWTVERIGGASIPVTAAVWRAKNGDRVDLVVPLGVQGTYRVIPSGFILDAADRASGGAANGLDTNDSSNVHLFAIGATLTVTLGASGYEHITIPVHDSSMIGPNLSTWSHDRVILTGVGPAPGLTTGFVRFDWRDAFVAVTGVSSVERIVSAAFFLSPLEGDSLVYEIRRCLQPWSDPASGGDWNSNPAGGPTWRDHAHPSDRWNQSGARVLGGTGGSVTDYDGGFDLSAVVDASPALPSLTQRVRFEGPLVTDAFRFWFENPQVDYGYGIRLAEAGSFTKFHRWEAELNKEGPVLEVTYASGAGVEAIPAVSEWGVAVLVLLMLSAASMILRTEQARAP